MRSNTIIIVSNLWLLGGLNSFCSAYTPTILVFIATSAEADRIKQIVILNVSLRIILYVFYLIKSYPRSSDSALLTFVFMGTPVSDEVLPVLGNYLVLCDSVSFV